MFAKLLFVVLLAGSQARPRSSNEPSANDLCPPDQSHYLLPHEYDCTKFYYCEYGLKWETPRDCAPGTQFSYELQVCVHPVVANCTLPGVPETNPETEAPETEAPETEAPETEAPETEAPETEAPETEAPETEAPETEAPETEAPETEAPETEAPETEAPETEAPVTEATTTTTALPSTEASVIETTSTAAPTEATTEEPTTTTTVSPSTEATVIETTSTAAPTEATTEEPTTTTTAAPSTEAAVIETTSTAAPTEATTEENAEWLENGCPADFDVHWLLPSENDCGKFYQCVFGQKVERECPASLHFNPTIQVCDWPENVGCVDGESSTTVAPTTTEDLTTTDASVGEWLENGCPSDFDVHWLLPSENDCGKFYQCNFGQKVERECPGSLHFNPAIQVCDWPENVGCVDGESSTTVAPTTTEELTTTDAPTSVSTEASVGEWLENGCPSDFNVHWLLPSENDCGKFYQCVFGQKVERECPASLHFNPAIQVCDWPENVGCVDGESSTTVAPTTTEELTTTDAPASASTEASVGEWLENGCPSDFDVHWLLPSENDCGKFYQCNFGQKVERECPASLHFNPTIQVCDWPENVGCVDGESSTTAAPTTTEDLTTTDASVGEWLENGCPSDFDVHWLLPSENDCGKFYQCNFGQKVERECPANLHFNPAIQVCDWPENAGCVEGESSTTTAPTTTEGPTTTVAPSSTPATNISTTAAPTTTEESTTTDAPTSVTTEPSVIETTSTAAPTEATTEDNTGWLDNGCPADFDVHWLLPHENDCGLFYYCLFGGKVERECPANLHFNPTLQVCDWPADAGCIDGESSTTAAPTTTEGTTTTEAPATNISTTAAPTSTEGPTTTVAPSSTPASNISTTAAPTTTEESTSTAAPTEATTEDNTGWLDNGCPADFDVHWLLPHENDCGLFYYCLFGGKVERECPANLHFNPTLQVCDWPADAGCIDGESSTTAAPTTTEGTTTTEAPATNISTTAAPTSTEGPTTTVAPSSTPASNISTTAAPTTTEESTSTAAPTEATTEDNTGWLDNGCPADFDVHWLLPHENDCGLFYYCLFGGKVERECPANLHFNPTLQVCDWPADAGCIDGESSTTAAPTTTEGTTTTEAPATNISTTAAPTSTEGPTTTVAPSSTPASNISTTAAPTTTEESTSTAAPTEATTEDNTGWLDNGCPADFDVHWLLPHENDCGLFYYCLFGGKVERECPANLHFNPTLQVCDWPADAGCIDGESSTTAAPTTTEGTTTTEAPATNISTTAAPTSTEGPTTTVAPSSTPASNISTTAAPTTTEESTSTAAPTEATTEDNTGWLDNGCPADFDVHWLLPHENDCGLFYYCLFGGKIERECPANLHFNPTLQVCDWPSDAGCIDLETSPTAAPTTTEEPTTTVAPSSTPATNISTTVAPTSTDGPTTTVAPSSTPASNISTTAAPTTTEEPTTTVAPSSTPASNISTTAAPTTTVEPTTTDAPASVTTETTSTATPTEATTEDNNQWLENGCPADFDVHWLLPSTENCTKFYQCVFGEKVERECPANLHFNPTLQVCDWQENAGCVLEDGDGETDGGENEIEPDNGKCASCNVLPWAHEFACDKYWRCEGETAVLVACSEGLHFNAQTASCDFICNANCVREVIQTTADERGLRVFLPWDKVDQTIRDTYAV